MDNAKFDRAKQIKEDITEIQRLQKLQGHREHGRNFHFVANQHYGSSPDSVIVSKRFNDAIMKIFEDELVKLQKEFKEL